MGQQMVELTPDEIAAEAFKNLLRMKYAKRLKGEHKDRYNLRRQFKQEHAKAKEAWLAHSRDHQINRPFFYMGWNNYAHIWNTRWHRAFPNGAYERITSKQTNRRSRHKTKEALRTGNYDIVGDQFEEYLPYID